MVLRRKAWNFSFFSFFSCVRYSALGGTVLVAVLLHARQVGREGQSDRFLPESTITGAVRLLCALRDYFSIDSTIFFLFFFFSTFDGVQFCGNW